MHTWLKCYSAKDRVHWEGEKLYYNAMKLQDWQLENVMECLWLREGQHCSIDNEFRTTIYNKLYVTKPLSVIFKIYLIIKVYFV